MAPAIAMRVLVCGQRGFTYREAIETELAQLPPDTTVIHGAARGADTLAGDVAKSLGFSVLVFPANWRKYGRAAGYIRNRQMLDDGRPNLVLAFYYDPTISRGTRNMVAQARKAGIPVQEFTIQSKARNLDA